MKIPNRSLHESPFTYSCFFDWFQGECASYPIKISMFCALSENNQHLLKITYASYTLLFKEFNNGIEILVGQWVLWGKTVKMLFGSITQ